MIAKNSLQPIDKVCLSVISLLSLPLLGLILGEQICGEKCFLANRPRVKEFSWQNKTIGAEDRGFVLTFDRPVDKTKVEKNLVIDPPLEGKMSWSGRRVAYTFNEPIPYGQTYQLSLSNVTESFRGRDGQGKTLKPFIGEFSSRDRALAYIGTQNEEKGRLIYYNLTKTQKIILTPPEWVVIDFKFADQGRKIVFSAVEQGKGVEGLAQLALYQVNVPLNEANSKITVEPLLDNQTYHNHQFDVTPDGNTIVVQRVNRQNPSDFDLWLLKTGQAPTPLNLSGGKFLIAPDGKTLAIARGEGISLLPLQDDTENFDFLPKFGQLLGFSPDGSAAAMVDFNTNDPNLRYTRSLFYVNNQGVQKELFNTQGSILDCQFGPQGEELYCLLTELIQGEIYIEQPYFAKIEIKTGKLTPLVALPQYRDIKLSLAPDGTSILFDQVITHLDSNAHDTLTTDTGEPIIEGKLWMLVPPQGDTPPQLQELGLSGIRPQWSP